MQGGGAVPKGGRSGQPRGPVALGDWYTALCEIARDWQVAQADKQRESGWVRGASKEAERQVAREGESQQEGNGMLRRMSPWVVRCELNVETRARSPWTRCGAASAAWRQRRHVVPSDGGRQCPLGGAACPLA